ncbi:hypothetical protein ACE3MS_15585 [Paenibacillus dendritiformis]|uniref:hypothetical protein n=1 Tax=Paenibacillus dendritiformis TaxID=130049 RepID=UPI0015EBCC0A|nr:hypothetical protein [Paenibacillus dendritiformis]
MKKEIIMDGVKYRVSNIQKRSSGTLWADVEKYYPQIDKWLPIENWDYIRKAAIVASEA